jgi:hydroxymethylbilane synthase
MIIGTRGSDLAKCQAMYVAAVLGQKMGRQVELKIISTKGDRITDRPLRELEGRGYFTKEIEEALLDRSVDVAVHSFKDMPSKAPEGLALAAVSKREDPADFLIIRSESNLETEGEIPLRGGAVVGTSAVRRETQLKAMRPDIVSKDLRGNVPTRLSKLAKGHYDSIFLAAAGVNRLQLDLSGYFVLRMDPSRFIPSPGQGALAIQMREGAPEFQAVHTALHDNLTATATTIERAVQGRFGGGCGLPLGVYARFKNDSWHAFGFWGGGRKPVWSSFVGNDPAEIVEALFGKLSQGSA